MLLALRLGRRALWSCGSRHHIPRLPYPSISINLLRHQHKKTSQNNPPTNPAEDPQTLGGMLLRFIRKETQFLSDSMNIEEAIDSQHEVATDKIDPALRNALIAEPDVHQQFASLLRLLKFSVHPDVLLHYYLLLSTVEESEKTQLLKWLVFYRQWHLFWQIAITDATSLSDVEDLVDLIHAELEINHNLTFGVWEVVRAAIHETTTASLLTSVIETVEYKFGLSKSQLISFISFIRELDNVETDDELNLLEESQLQTMSDSFICKAFFLQTRLRVSDPTDAIESIKDEKAALKSPGWYSFLTSLFADNLHYLTSIPQKKNPSLEQISRTTLMSHFLHYRLAKMNESDFFSLIQTATSQDAHRIFLIAYKNSQRGLIQNNRLIDHVVQLAIGSGNNKLILECVRKFYIFMSLDSWQQLFQTVLRDDPGVIELFEHKRPSEFQAVSKSALYKGFSSQDTVALVSHCNNNRFTIRSALKSLHLDKKEAQEVLDGLRGTKLTAYNLIETLRFAFRHHIVDETSCQIIDRILHKTWNGDVLLKRGQRINYQVRDDFRFFYAMATPDERVKLTETLQTLGHAISLLETEEIASFMNNLNDYFFASNQFTFINSTTGKTYILDRLIKKTMQFVFKHHAKIQPKDGVKQIRDILRSLRFDSSPGQASLFEFIVHENPAMAFEILNNYKTKKSVLVNPIMEGIARGVLRAKTLTPYQRVMAFEKFHQSAKELGFKYQMSARLTVLLGNLILKLENISRNPKSNLLQPVIQYGITKGVPHAIIKKWSKALP